MTKQIEALQLALEALEYSPDTGIFTWKTTRSKMNAGEKAGYKCKEGYLHIRIGGVSYRAHRLAWLITHGEWPSKMIDHINGIRDDNRICNLRCASDEINSQNQRRACVTSKTGLLGVFCDASRLAKPFYSTIGVNKKKVWLGRYETAQQAHQAYLNAKRELHKGCSI